MAIQTIQLPDGMDIGVFASSMRHINKDAVVRVEGRPNFICLWDDTVAPVPTQAEIEAAVTDAAAARRRRDLKAAAREIALDRITADINADIDSDAITREDEIESSGKWRNPKELI